ncbi:MAG: hypothetical protein WCO05_03450 [Candidatus Moraniibacteriota bacterium]
MNDFCDCSQCPHHCGEDDEINLPAEDTSTKPAPDDSEDNPLDNKVAAEEKIEKLKKAISDLGFKLEDTKEGIRVSM